MQKLSDKFLKERFEKDERYFRLYDFYVPNCKRQGITEKFYSSTLKHQTPDPKLVENIERGKRGIPNQKFAWPMIESQSYGWFLEPFIDVDRTDFIHYHPQMCFQYTKQMVKVQNEDKCAIVTKAQKKK